MKSKLFSAALSRAARGLLGWTPEQLARAADLEPEAVALFEASRGVLGAAEAHRLAQAFNRAGVIAIAADYAGEGVRFRARQIGAWP